MTDYEHLTLTAASVLMVLLCASVAWSGEPASPSNLPPLTLPAGCSPSLPDLELCGDGGRQCVFYSPEAVAHGLSSTSPRIAVDGLDLIVQASNTAFTLDKGNWAWSALPTREGYVMESAQGAWFASHSNAAPTMRFWKRGRWTRAMMPPAEGRRWRHQPGPCPTASRFESYREGDLLRQRFELSFYHKGAWTSPWKASFSGAGRVSVFPARNNKLVVFYNVSGPRGHTIWWGHPGGPMTRLAGPLDTHGKPLRAQGVYFGQTATESIAIVSGNTGLFRVDLDTGAQSVIVPEIKEHVRHGDILTESWKRPSIIKLLTTKRSARLLYRIDGGTRRKKTNAPLKPGDRDRGPRKKPVTLEDESWRTFWLVDLAHPGKPQRLQQNTAWISDATIDARGNILLAIGDIETRGDKTTSVYTQKLAVQKSPGRPGRPAPVDVRKTRTDQVDLAMDSEDDLIEAGFQRWGIGSTTFDKGILRLDTESYEEWMPSLAQGLMRGNSESVTVKTRMRVVSQKPKKGNSTQKGQVNAGLRLSGRGYSATLQFSETGLSFKFNGEHLRKEVDMKHFHDFEISVHGGVANLRMDGTTLAILKGKRPPHHKVDQVYVTFGALGGSIMSTSEWDTLEVTPR